MISQPAAVSKLRPVGRSVGSIRNQDLVGGQTRVPWATLAFILAHLPLALAMKRVSWLPEAHSLIVLAIGLFYASDRRNPLAVVKVTAYLVGSEVLWRMGGGGVFWEFGKYAFAVILGVALWRQQHRALDQAASAYFFLLLPSVLLTLLESSLSVARQDLSFYLSGPFALVIGVSFFKRLSLSPGQLQSVLLVLLAPIVGVAGICYGSTFGVDEITFGASASKAASGGLAANQVSAVLGLGIVAIMLCLWITPSTRPVRWLLVGALLLCFTQALLTLSRTGIWLAAICSGLAALQMARSSRQIITMAASLTVVALLCWLIIIPEVQELSGGAVARRFSQTSGTGREDIAGADLRVWADHPLLGVGVGVAVKARQQYYDVPHASHTEYTRLLSEHGILGAISLVLLFYLPARAFLFARTLTGRILASVGGCFGLLFMSVSAMRLLLPAFMLSLACAQICTNKAQRSRSSCR